MLKLSALCVATVVGAATLQAQVPCFSNTLGTNLNLFDDDVAQGLPLGFTFNFGGVAYTDICVSSNGYIWLGPTSLLGSDFTPTEAELLSGAPRICPLWTDFDATDPLSGGIFYDNSTPGIARITWNNVAEYNTSNYVTVQVTLDATSGITVYYGSTPAAGGTLTQDVIIGCSPGNGATSNLVSFGALPVVSASDTLAEVITVTGGTIPIPYADQMMIWSPTTPGYIVLDQPCAPPARFDVVGVGCPAPTSITLYETFGLAGSTPDVASLDRSFLPNGVGGYLILSGVSATYFTGQTNNLNMSDDSTAQVALPFAFPHGGTVVNNIVVSSNGFITLGTTDPGNLCCTGVPATMLAGPPMIAAWWADLYPPGGSGVFADLDPVSGDFVISWICPEFFSNPLVDCQIALSPTGQFTIRWSAVSAASHTFVSGYSSAEGAPDPGPGDLSAAIGLDLGPRLTPLSLTAVGNSVPTIGQVFTSTVTSIAPSPQGNICILLLGTELPGGAPLDGLGLIGCTAHANLPALATFLNVTLGAPSTNYALGIPNTPAFIGVSLMSQAVSDDATANPFGWRVSNGGRWTFGL